MASERRLWIARQTAEALDALHQGGYLHGDVKPANIFLAASGHLTLLDLNFAQRLDETGSAVNRLVLGTINYLAPELLTSTLRADERSDIFSLGVVLFEMLMGRPPLEARGLPELLRLHNEYARRRCAARRPDLPPALATLVRQMLFKEPLRRPQSIAKSSRNSSGWRSKRSAGARPDPRPRAPGSGGFQPQ